MGTKTSRHGGDPPVRIEQSYKSAASILVDNLHAPLFPSSPSYVLSLFCLSISTRKADFLPLQFFTFLFGLPGRAPGQPSRFSFQRHSLLGRHSRLLFKFIFPSSFFTPPHFFRQHAFLVPLVCRCRRSRPSPSFIGCSASHETDGRKHDEPDRSIGFECVCSLLLV